MFRKILAKTFQVAYVLLMASINFAEPSKTCDPLLLSMTRNMETGRRLKSRAFESQPISFELECYMKCLENCRCLSYNVCNGGKLCELNSERGGKNAKYYEKNYQCDYHDFDFEDRIANDCKDPCCKTSQVCLNGGRCQATCMEHGTRFKCLVCPDGHAGERCEILPRSCNAYNKSPNRTHGLRLVYDPDNTTYHVFCHMRDTESLTMVMSFSRDNLEHPANNQTLRKNFPVSENSPNFIKYRLSYRRMVGIRDHSKYWRYSCKYDESALKSNVKLRAQFVSLNPLVFDSGKSKGCSKNIDIKISKNEKCFQCNVSVIQGDGLLYVTPEECDSGWAKVPNYRCANGELARYFGDYGRCYDPSFLCTKSAQATTQLWFH